jgi:hypothetical protein
MKITLDTAITVSSTVEFDDNFNIVSSNRKLKSLRPAKTIPYEGDEVSLKTVLFEPTSSAYSIVDERMFTCGVEDTEACKLLYVEEEAGRTNLISPVVRPGYYYNGKYKDYLYGDSSVSFSPYDEKIDLPFSFSTDDYLIDNYSPITISIFGRRKDTTSYPLWVYKQVDTLTTELVEIGRDELPGEPSTYLREFTIDFSADGNLFEINIPNWKDSTYFFWDEESIPDVEQVKMGDFLGYSNGKSCQLFWTFMFPIAQDVRLFAIVNEGEGSIVVELELTDSFFPESGDYLANVNRITGLIRLGGIRGQSVYTLGGQSYPVGPEGNYFIEVDDADKLPTSGHLEYLDTIISYRSKLGNKLIGCYCDSSLEVEPLSELKPSESGLVLPLGSMLYASYTAVPMIRFQTEEGAKEVRRVSSNNLAPYQLEDQASIVVLDRSIKNVSLMEIESLNTGKTRLETGEIAYGPVYPNESIVVFKGQALSRNRYPVSNVKGKAKVSGTGSINYSKETEFITNDEGCFYFEYIAGNNRTDFKEMVSYRYEAEGDVTYLKFEGGNYSVISGQLDLISLYAVTKEDMSQGGRGHLFDLDSPSIPLRLSDPAYVTGKPFKDAFIASINIEQEDLTIFDGGTIEFLDSLGNTLNKNRIHSIVRNRTLMTGFREQDGSFIIRTESPITLLAVESFTMFYKEAKKYTGRKGQGKKTVLRTLVRSVDEAYPNNSPLYTPWIPDDTSKDLSTSEWLHPTSKDSESDPYSYTFKPVTPIGYIGDNTFVFAGQLPVPEKSNIRNILGGYGLFVESLDSILVSIEDLTCPGNTINQTILIANQTSPVDNGTIEVRFRTYVPYGFRLVSDNFDGAATLDTATYLTINDVNRVAYNIEDTSIASPFISFIEGPTLGFSEIMYQPNRSVVVELVIE